MLKIEHLTKIYGDKKAVDDLSLHIRPGEIYGFIGHNGAGKTTTIKSCAGILQFEQGEITIDGRSVKTDPLGCKQILAYIPDNPDLYEFLSGIKYLNFVADIFGVSKQDREARIEKYADLFDLTGDLAQPISAYSHGMKQKLAIISALIHDPKLIIMDEPFVGLDPTAAYQVKGIMREHCERGGAIFFSTHVLEVAEKLCDKVAIIKQGRLIASGTMDEVKGDQSLEDVFLELEGEKNAKNAASRPHGGAARRVYRTESEAEKSDEGQGRRLCFFDALLLLRVRLPVLYLVFPACRRVFPGGTRLAVLCNVCDHGIRAHVHWQCVYGKIAAV